MQINAGAFIFENVTVAGGKMCSLRYISFHVQQIVCTFVCFNSAQGWGNLSLCQRHWCTILELINYCRSIYEGGTENISFLNFPVRDQNVYIYEVSSNASVCPAGLCKYQTDI